MVKKVELKSEVLPGGVFQGDFNYFAKFTVNYLRWSLF